MTQSDSSLISLPTSDQNVEIKCDPQHPPCDMKLLYFSLFNLLIRWLPLVTFSTDHKNGFNLTYVLCSFFDYSTDLPDFYIPYESFVRSCQIVSICFVFLFFVLRLCLYPCLLVIWWMSQNYKLTHIKWLALVLLQLCLNIQHLESTVFSIWSSHTGPQCAGTVLYV